MIKKKKNTSEFKKEIDNKNWRMSQPYVCTSCGKKDCWNIWHILKLSMQHSDELRTGHFLVLYSIAIIVFLFGVIIYNILLHYLP